MSCTVKVMKPYTYTNLPFAATSTTHMGDVEAWASSKMTLEFVSWDSGEEAHVTYGVVATDSAKEPGDDGWLIGRVTMSVDVEGDVALSEVLMRRMVDEFKVVMRNRVAQGQALVEFEGGAPVFKQTVTFATV